MLRRRSLGVRGENRALHRDRRGARLTRRDEEESWAYSTTEQRREAECIAGRMQWDFHHELLGRPRYARLSAAKPEREPSPV